MIKKENLSIEDVAKLLNLSLVTIQRWDHQGKIPSKMIKRKKCFIRKEILQWAEDHDFIVRTQNTSVDEGSGELLAGAIKRGGLYYDVPGEDIIEVLENIISELPFLRKADHKMILEEMLNREELASTGIGDGIAIPHTRERLDLGLEEIYISVAFLKRRINFNAIDGKLVFVLFIIFTNKTNDHLMVLSRISRVLKDNKIIEILSEKNKDLNLLKTISQIEQTFHT